MTLRSRIALAGLLASAGGIAGVRPCLSVSPFRASQSSDTVAVKAVKLRLLDSLRARLGGGWQVEAAGGCPSDAQVLDLFQRPGDLVEAGGNSLLRARLEWRHAPGMVIVSLEPQGRLQGDAGLWATMLEATIRTQLLVPIQVSSDAAGSVVTGDLAGLLPVSGMLPPGRIRLRLEAQGRVPAGLDTLLVPGLPVQLDVHLLPLPAALPLAVPRAARRAHWVSYGVGGLCLAGAGWFALRQASARERYAGLGGDASRSQFEARWDAVRQANLWRNGLGGAGLGALGLGAFLQLRDASFSW